MTSATVVEQVRRAKRSMKPPSELRVIKANKLTRATRNVARIRTLLQKLKERLEVA